MVANQVRVQEEPRKTRLSRDRPTAKHGELKYKLIQMSASKKLLMRFLINF